MRPPRSRNVAERRATAAPDPHRSARIPCQLIVLGGSLRRGRSAWLACRAGGGPVGVLNVRSRRPVSHPHPPARSSSSTPARCRCPAASARRGGSGHGFGIGLRPPPPPRSHPPAAPPPL